MTSFVIDYELLSQTRAFTGVDESDFEALLAHLKAKIKQYQRDEMIFCAGQRSHRFGIVLVGSVHVEGSDAQGNISVMGAFHAGEMFGEAYAVLGNVPLLTSVVAAEPSEVLLLDVRQLTTHVCAVCTGLDRLTTNLLQSIAEKNVMLSRRIQDAAPKSIRGKLLAYLNTRTQMEGSREFDIPFNRQQLADYLGVDRSALSAVISSLARQGVIKVHRSHFEML